MTSGSISIDPESRRFVALDRDGTIIIEKNYLSEVSQVELVPGAGSGLRQIADMGLGLVVLTNQSGVGRRYFDHARVGEVNQLMADFLEADGVRLDGIYYCPHLPQDGCACRKPGLGMLELTAQELNFDAGACFVVGDKASDVEMGRRAGATTFLVSTGYGAMVAREGTTTADYEVNDLTHAALVIRELLAGQKRVES